MAEFEIGERKYRSGRMNARTQFHVLRRMAGILPQMQSAVAAGMAMKVAQDAGRPPSLEMQADAVKTGLEFMGALGTLTDEVSDYILDNCLAVVDVQQSEFTKWSKLKTASGMMFDLDMTTMLQIVVNVIQDNYAELFRGGLAALSGEASVST